MQDAHASADYRNGHDESSASVFKIKYFLCWILRSRTGFEKIMKKKIRPGDLSDVSAKKEPVHETAMMSRSDSPESET